MRTLNEYQLPSPILPRGAREAEEDFGRLLDLVERGPFVARVRLGDVAGAEDDRRHARPGDRRRIGAVGDRVDLVRTAHAIDRLPEPGDPLVRLLRQQGRL